jgi:2-keto-3-deoxy-L-rhamnonate aldolase RhmA
MQENRVKRIMNAGGLALGTHVGGIADPQIVEIIGLAGFDAPLSTWSTPATTCATCSWR